MSDPSQALELEKFLPYRLSILAQTVSDSLHDLYAEPFGLSVTQWRVMAALSRFAPLTASDVGQRIVMDKVAVSRAVARLMQRGLIERATDRADRRRASLRLSARGRAMHARIVPLALSYQDRLYDVLSDVERRTFDALMDRLLAHASVLGHGGGGAAGVRARGALVAPTRHAIRPALKRREAAFGGKGRPAPAGRKAGAGAQRAQS